MEFEWDELKNQSNIKKHGIDFRDAVLVFKGDLNIKKSAYLLEERWLAIGVVKKIVITLVFTL